MTDSITPPKLATLLLNLFSGEPDFPQIEGDLSEEFHNRLLASGPNIARRSYRREVFRTMWVLAKRSSTIRVLAVAALSMCISGFSVGLFSNWLNTLGERGSPFGLRVSAFVFILLFIYLFNTTIALVLGILTSRFLKEREHMLRLAFTGFYLLFVVGGYVVMAPIVLNRYFTLNIINWSLVLSAFWIGSVCIRRRGLRRMAG